MEDYLTRKKHEKLENWKVDDERTRLGIKRNKDLRIQEKTELNV